MFYESNSIHRKKKSSRTHSKMGFEDNNRTPHEMAKTMLYKNLLLKHFWTEEINTACYVESIILIIPILEKTPYEL